MGVFEKMLFNKTVKKFISLMTSVVLMFSLALPALAASEGSDINGHWAEQELRSWLKQGFINGFDDGTVRPNKEITRAEFMAFVNRAFGLTDKATLNFSDIPSYSTAWYVNDVAVAVANGYITGFGDGTIRPNDTITRQEVAAIVARLLDLNLVTDDDLLNQFGDASGFATWSLEEISAVVGNGYMKGFTDGTFQPYRNITRAEAVAILDRVIHDKFLIYSEAGTYGPVEGNETIAGNVLISVAGVTLQNVTVTGDLVLGVGIGEGDVYLDGVTVKGKTTVQGGGENSIHIINTNLYTVVIDKQNGSVRIVASGNTSVEEVTLQSGAKLEAADNDGDGFKNVSVKIADNGQVILSGDFENVQIDAPNVVVSLEKGSIQQLNVNEGAGNTSIQLQPGATVAELKLDAKADVTGSGTIAKAVINTEGSTIEQKPAEVQVAEGVSANVGGEQVTESIQPVPAPSPAPIIPPSTGGGGEQPQIIPMTKITLNKSFVSIGVGASETLEVLIEPENATNKDVRWSTTDASIVSVDQNGKITAVASGTAIINVTSIANPSVNDFIVVIVQEPRLSIKPTTATEYVIVGSNLSNSEITLSSNYNATGLKTFISLKNGNTPVNFDTVFDSFALSTRVGEGEAQGPYNMVGSYSVIPYGPTEGFGIDSGVDQVTTTTGKVRADAPVGTYTITTEVKNGENVVATATYTLNVIEEQNVDYFQNSSAFFIENGNYLNFHINGILTDSIDVTKLIYKTDALGESSYRLSGSYIKVTPNTPVKSGQYYYWIDLNRNTTSVNIYLTEEDAAKIKGLNGYGNTSVDSRNANTDRLTSENGWYPSATSGTKTISISNHVRITNQSKYMISGIYQYMDDQKYPHSNINLEPNAEVTFPINSNATKLVFHVGTFNHSSIPTSGLMRVIHVSDDILSGITLDDSNWIEVTGDNFGNDTAPADPGTKLTINNTDLSVVDGQIAASFTWYSDLGAGTLNGRDSGAYTYYDDGAYLRFQVLNHLGVAVPFTQIFQTSDDGNNTTGGMTLQTNGGTINDMDGSNRERADWGVAGLDGFKTNLPNDGHYVFYGLIQAQEYGTKTVGFSAEDTRTINMTLAPRTDLTPGTYKVIVQACIQGQDNPTDTMVLFFNIVEPAEGSSED